jgi:hypothetical protein
VLLLRFGSLDRASNRMRGDSFPPPLELSLVEEAKARRQERYVCRRLVHVRRECRCRSRLVVFLQKAGELVLVIGVGVKVPANGPRAPFAKAIAQPLEV